MPEMHLGQPGFTYSACAYALKIKVYSRYINSGIELYNK